MDLHRYEGMGEVADEPEVFEPEPAPDFVPSRMSRFRSLYESRDGKLCLYEDESGHLMAVDASKFA